jgi:hypothetical protein
LRHDQRVSEGEVGGEEAGGGSFVFDAEPIEAAIADVAVVEVFGVVGAAGDVEGFVLILCAQGDGLGLAMELLGSASMTAPRVDAVRSTGLIQVLTLRVLLAGQGVCRGNGVIFSMTPVSRQRGLLKRGSSFSTLESLSV